MVLIDLVLHICRLHTNEMVQTCISKFAAQIFAVESRVHRNVASDARDCECLTVIAGLVDKLKPTQRKGLSLSIGIVHFKLPNTKSRQDGREETIYVGNRGWIFDVQWVWQLT